MKPVPFLDKIGVDGIDRPDIDHKRHRDREQRYHGSDMRLVLYEIGGHMQAGPGGDDCRQNHHVPIAPYQRSAAVRLENMSCR